MPPASVRLPLHTAQHSPRQPGGAGWWPARELGDMLRMIRILTLGFLLICPACRHGRMFRSLFVMNVRGPGCGVGGGRGAGGGAGGGASSGGRAATGAV